jgi:uncharacterized membrane protein YgaE (UPF0421/DUF939 family)
MITTFRLEASMQRIVYKTFKLSIGFVVAVYIAMLLNTPFELSAGIITLLNLMDTRRDSLKVAWRRLYSSIIGLGLSSFIFIIFGFHVLNLGFLLILFIPITHYLNAREGVIINLVLASHLIALESVAPSVLMNEFLLVIIGALVALVLNLHMPSRRNDLEELRNQADEQIKAHYLLISHKLKDYHGLNIVTTGLDDLEATLKRGKKLAYEQLKNDLFNDDTYYIDYFQMRLFQLYRLRHIKENLSSITIVETEAFKLSQFFEQVALTYHEFNDGNLLLEKVKDLNTLYRKAALPESRQAFENRAKLFQILSDIEAAIRKKQEFMTSRSKRPLNRH